MLTRLTFADSQHALERMGGELDVAFVVDYPTRVGGVMGVAKLSITIEESDLKWVKSEAKRLKRSVSAVVADAVAQKRALRAQRRYLKNAGPVDEKELRRVIAELEQ